MSGMIPSFIFEKSPGRKAENEGHAYNESYHIPFYNQITTSCQGWDAASSFRNHPDERMKMKAHLI